MTSDTPRSPTPPPTVRAVRHARSPLSWIWLVPAVAVLLTLGLTIHALMQRGPQITLQFSSAEGLEAKKTKLKYKDVEIGTVSDIALSDDRRSVKVTVAMQKQAEPLLVDDSRFWVVRPRIGTGGVSGLGTLLSGAYLAIDPGRSPQPRHTFIGLDKPPVVVNDMPGRQFLLSARDLGSLDIGVPVYFRRIPVGRVVGYALQQDGHGVEVRIFVDAPYDRFVNAGTRFWHADGLNVALDAEGLKLQMQSLVSVAVGGIAFANPDKDSDGADAPAQATPETRFELYTDRTEALRQPDSVVETYRLTFDESVRGLAIGAPVDFRGLTVGEVSRINFDYRRGADSIVMNAEIKLYPERFLRRWRNRATASSQLANTRAVVDDLVAKGLRAQLRTGNLLTGQRYVALDFFPKARAARVDWQQPVPRLPTQPGSLDSLQEQLQTLMDGLQKTLGQADQLIATADRTLLPELTATLKSARDTLQRADGVLASDAPTQQELRNTLREVGRAAGAVRNLADMLERQPEALITGKKAPQ